MMAHVLIIADCLAHLFKSLFIGVFAGLVIGNLILISDSLRRIVDILSGGGGRDGH